MTSRWVRAAAVAVSAAAILAATTFPTSDLEPGSARFCLLCGDRGLADALLNIALFMPLGAALALARAPKRLALLTSLAFSALIETAQLFVISGRDPSVGDILFNALGAMGGFGLAATSAWWISPTSIRGERLSWAWSGAAGAVIVGTGLVLSPSFPEATYYAGWTPRFGHLRWYDGQVLTARLGDLPVEEGPIADSRRARALLVRGGPLTAQVVGGSPPLGLAPVVSLQDERRRLILIVGVDGADLVLRYRTRASALRLSQPDLRARGAMRGVTHGDTLQIMAWRQNGAHCLQRDADRRCGLAFRVVRGWGLLTYPAGLNALRMRFLDALWMTVLIAPLGLWVRPTWRGFSALAPLGIALIGAPMVTDVGPWEPGDVAAAAVGVIGAFALHAACGRATRTPGHRAAETGI